MFKKDLMLMMGINRRVFIKFLASSSIFYSQIALGEAKHSPIFFSAFNNERGESFISSFNQNGKILFTTPLNYRGHSVLYNKQNNTIAVFSRRPGNKISILDYSSGVIINEFKSHLGYHFCGHGCFSNNGKILFTSENNYEKH